MAEVPDVVELDRATCVELLRSATLGRVAVVVGGACPEVFPVNHVYDDLADAVAFPAPPGRTLTAFTTGLPAVFEIDGEEPAGGWSVVATGVVHLLRGERAAALRAQRRRAWADGDGAVWCEMRLSSISGRRVVTIESASVTP